MKNIKKILLCCVCVAAIVGGTVLATLAYLTDTSEAVNTFTVGNVDIEVDEEKVNPDGTPTEEDDDRVQENNYHLLPGQTYLKDPTMTVKAGGEDSYVRMILVIHNHDDVQPIVDKHLGGDYASLLGEWDSDTWRYIGFTENSTDNTISFEFRYYNVDEETAIVPASDKDQVLQPLFQQLIIPATINGDELATLYGVAGIGGDDFRMTVMGHAIQASGFADEDEAWAGFDAQKAFEEQNP